MRSTLELKIGFFKFFLSLIGDYLPFYNQLEEDKVLIANNIFQFEKYIKSLKPANKGFMADMIKTQMFFTFIDKSYSALNNYNELFYFMKGSKLLQNGDIVKLENNLKIIYKNLMENYKNVNT